MSKAKGYAPIVRSNGGAEFIQNTIRLPPHVYKSLRDAAEQTGRSLHAEILQRVVSSLNLPPEIIQGGSVLERMADDLRILRELAQQHMATGGKS